MKHLLISYAMGTLATLIKTLAWWMNQWPWIREWEFMGRWVASAGTAGLEYAPLTMAMTVANSHNIHLGLLTSYMICADNLLRMMQQLALRKPLAYYDWVAAILLCMCVVFEGWHHYHVDKKAAARVNPETMADDGSNSEESEGGRARTEGRSGGGGGGEREGRVELASLGTPQTDDEQLPPLEKEENEGNQTPQPLLSRSKLRCALLGVALLVVALALIAALGGPGGQAYALAITATGAKTFAWWINQYPILQNASFVKKWLAGWSIAAVIEYFPLIGAFAIASDNSIHLGLMTAFMIALDNGFRVAQQYVLSKPQSKVDYLAAFGMFLAIIYQGLSQFFS